MGKAKILESEYQNIINLYTNGLSQYKIAEKYNVSRGNIKYILDKFPEMKQYSKRRLANFYISDEGKIVSLYLNGNSIVKIGKLFNVNPTTVANVLEKKQY